LITEHWDNLIEVQPKNPSGRTQIDGPTEIKDIEKTAENKAFIKDFVQTILMRGEMEQLEKFFDGDNYIQHNPSIADGLSGLGAALKAMAEQGIKMEYHKIHMVLGEGNYVLTVSEGFFGGKPTSYYDLFRVENGKVAEHWDVMETIADKSEWKNENGKF
jgi:predicted SnoaL-like aldol condensation-catalyzing enzyme